MITPLSRVIENLIMFAEEVLRAPQMHTRAPVTLADLLGEVTHRHNQPAEDVRTTRAALVMVTALDGFFVDCDDSWLMLAGATLPLLKREGWQQMLNEKTARAEVVRR